MKLIVKSLLLAGVGFLVGCETPYQAMKSNGGFSAEQVGPNQFNVAFAGNGFTTGEHVHDFAMLRAADIAVRKGYRYLTVDGNRNTFTQTMGAASFPGHTSGTASTVGGITTFNATVVPPTTINYPITFPGHEYTVTFHHTIPDTWRRVYDVVKLREQITTKYRLRPDALPTFNNPIVTASVVKN
jgi:hypothetical protein